MSTSTIHRPSATSPGVAPADAPAGRPSPARRFFGVVARPRSYGNIAYLLLDPRTKAFVGTR